MLIYRILSIFTMLLAGGLTWFELTMGEVDEWQITEMRPDKCYSKTWRGRRNKEHPDGIYHWDYCQKQKPSKDAIIIGKGD